MVVISSECYSYVGVFKEFCYTSSFFSYVCEFNPFFRWFSDSGLILLFLILFKVEVWNLLL